MTSQNILYIEASKADYKEQLEEKKPRSWLKSVSAFANTHGGHLIFGVKNEPRTVVGLADPQAVISKATELIKARIDPAPRYMVQVSKSKAKSVWTWRSRMARPTRTIMRRMESELPTCGTATSRWRRSRGN